MPVIDENGDLFRHVNAVNALAVLFVVVVLLIAGIIGVAAFGSKPA